MSKNKMNLKEYQKFVLGLMSPKSMESFESQIDTFVYGLTGEAGEVADLMKKIKFHGLEFNEENKIKLKKELGDILFYLTFAAHVLGTTVPEIMQMNVEKLQDRYKTGKFTVSEFKAKEAKKGIVEHVKMQTPREFADSLKKAGIIDEYGGLTKKYKKKK